MSTPTSLREARKARGLTQIQLSERLRVHQCTLSQWELGHYRPRGPARSAIARELGVPEAVVDGWFDTAA